MVRKATHWILVLLAAGLMGVPAMAQISTHFDLRWHVLSGGGGARGSSHYQMDDATGQWADGRSSSSHYRINPGYWYAGDRKFLHRIYLPLIQNSGLETR